MNMRGLFRVTVIVGSFLAIFYLLPSKFFYIRAQLENICCSTPGDCQDPSKPNCVEPGAGQEDCDRAHGTLLNKPRYCAAPSGSNPSFRIPNYREIGQSGFRFFQGNPSTLDVGKIVSELLPYVYVLAGLLLFGYLIYGGFHLVTSFGSPKAILEAWLIIFRALVGFVMVFVSFWLIQIVERIFGLDIL